MWEGGRGEKGPRAIGMVTGQSSRDSEPEHIVSERLSCLRTSGLQSRQSISDLQKTPWTRSCLVAALPSTLQVCLTC